MSIAHSCTASCRALVRPSISSSAIMSPENMPMKSPGGTFGAENSPSSRRPGIVEGAIYSPARCVAAPSGRWVGSCPYGRSSPPASPALCARAALWMRASKPAVLRAFGATAPGLSAASAAAAEGGVWPTFPLPGGRSGPWASTPPSRPHPSPGSRGRPSSAGHARFCLPARPATPARRESAARSLAAHSLHWLSARAPGLAWALRRLGRSAASWAGWRGPPLAAPASPSSGEGGGEAIGVSSGAEAGEYCPSPLALHPGPQGWRSGRVERVQAKSPEAKSPAVMSTRAAMAGVSECVGRGGVCEGSPSGASVVARRARGAGVPGGRAEGWGEVAPTGAPSAKYTKPKRRPAGGRGGSRLGVGAGSASAPGVGRGFGSIRPRARTTPACMPMYFSSRASTAPLWTPMKKPQMSPYVPVDGERVSPARASGAPSAMNPRPKRRPTGGRSWGGLGAGAGSASVLGAGRGGGGSRSVARGTPAVVPMSLSSRPRVAPFETPMKKPQMSRYAPAAGELAPLVRTSGAPNAR